MMSRASTRMRVGAAGLLAIFAVSTLVYALLGDFTPLEAIWFVTITISSVGFAEKSSLPWGLQLFTVVVIVLGLSTVTLTFGSMVQMMAEGEIDRVLGRRRMTRGIDRLHDHVILVGFGRTGQILAQELMGAQLQFVVIDNRDEAFKEANELGYLGLTGDATDEQTLQTAAIERANILVTSLPSDADNVFITLTARNLNPRIRIIARAEIPSTEKKLRQAGADQIVLPAQIGALRMARLITRPHTTKLMELVSDRSSVEIEMDEITLAGENPLIGQAVVDAAAHRDYRLLVVAVKHEDETMTFNPGGAYVFQPGDTLIVTGKPADIQGFRERFHQKE